MNEGEPQMNQDDILKMYREYSDESLEVFRKMLDVFSYIEKEKLKNEKNQNASIISVHNHFVSLI
jgi:hypothetical protein